MRYILVLISFLFFSLNLNLAKAAACSSGSQEEDYDCCQADGSTSGTKKTLSNTDDSTRRCTWPADSKFEFRISKFGLLPTGGSESDIVYRGESTLFNAGSVSAGESMGAFLAGADFPDGSYEAIVPHLKLSETVKASTAPTITYSGSDIECETNQITVEHYPSEDDRMCEGESAIDVDHEGTEFDYTIAVGTFGTDYGPDLDRNSCFLDTDGNDTADEWKIFDNQISLTLSKSSSVTLDFNFNTSDGIIYSVFDDYGYGDAFSGPACKAVDIGGLDVTITQQ
tara:strand:- start:343 stop:1191 length:849 start_codon:yes stop_codon:yes gene_type:complete